MLIVRKGLAVRRYEFDYDARNIYVYCRTFRDEQGREPEPWYDYAPVRAIPRPTATTTASG